MDADREALVHAYWRHYVLSSGDRSDRLAAEQDFWAVEAVFAAIDDDQPQVVELLADLLAAPEADVQYFGLGPLEDLLATQPQHAAVLAERCRREPRWGEALAAVSLDSFERSRLGPLTDLLPPPPPR